MAEFGDTLLIPSLRAELPDWDLQDGATELGRVLFSQDEDLLAEATKRQRSGTHFAGVNSIPWLGA